MDNSTIQDTNATSGIDQGAINIECWAIPYGLVGFLSHGLTYYTILCLSFGRKPLMPWSELTGAWHDPILAVVTGIAAFVLGLLNAVRCNFSFALLLLSVWKMLFSLLVSAQAFLAWNQITQGESLSESRLGSAFMKYAVLTYTLISLLALGALASLESNVGYTPGVLLRGGSNWQARTCEILTIVFVLIAVVGGLLSSAGGAYGLLGFLAVVFALYVDWVMGVLAWDALGSPQENFVAYWVYFAVKRLPFFMG